MEKILRCIVKNKIYEVTFFEEKAPANCVLTQPNIKDKIYKYDLPNGIDVKIFPTNNNDPFCIFRYNRNHLKIMNNRNLQSVADYLNKFNNISKEELNELLEEAQNKTKSKLEQEIEELEAEKQALEDKMEIYRQIQSKKDEIKDLMQQLEEE